MKLVTVLIVTYKRPFLLKQCITGLINARRFQDIGVFVLVNGADQETESLMEVYAQDFKNIRYIKGEHYSRGAARNILISQSKESDILYFLDDDCMTSFNVFSVLAGIIEAYPDVDCFGGPNLTHSDAGIFEQAQGHVLGSFLGAMWVRNRYRSCGSLRIVDDKSLILCNLAVRRRVFCQTGLSFNERLACAEENLLIENILRSGYKCMHVPDLVVFHERRKTVREFILQMFLYGRGRCQVILHNHVKMLPIVIAASLVAIIIFLFYQVRIAFMFAVIIYIALCVVSACQICWRINSAILFKHLLYLFPVIHLAYVSGFLSELLSSFRNRSHLLFNRMARFK